MKYVKQAMINTVLAVFVSLFLAGCGEEKKPEPTAEQLRQRFVFLEQERETVNANAKLNANSWRNENMPDIGLYMRGDSTISDTCPIGDGWVSVDLLNKTDGKVVGKLKCSSVSRSIGCMTEADFKARKDYSDQDGTCNKTLPSPLPKIAG